MHTVLMGVRYLLLFSVCTSLWIPQVCSAQIELDFLTFFGCSAEDNLTSLHELERCDLFAYIGAEVARDIVNRDLDKLVLNFHQERIDSAVGSEVSVYSTKQAFW